MTLVASSGLWTTVRPTVAPKPSSAYGTSTPVWSSCTLRVHASWLNQVEIYFSIIQRKVLTPNDLTDLNALAERLLDFQYYWENTARPFEWKFTRQDLAKLLDKLATPR